MAGEYQRPGSDPNPDNDITVPNVFGGPRRDDPAAIVPGLGGADGLQAPTWGQPGDGPDHQDPAGPGGGRHGVPEYGYGAVPPGPAELGATQYSGNREGGRRHRAADYHADQVVPPLVEAAMLASDGRRRRNALLGVLAVVVLTVAVVLAALLIAPKWSNNNANPEPTPPPSTASSAPATSNSLPEQSSIQSDTATSSAPTTNSAAPINPTVTTTTISGPPPSASALPHTVTVTATATSKVSPATSAKPSGPLKPTTPRSTPSPSPKPPKPTPTPTPTPTPPPLGVPQQNIACSQGYIVQLASELDPATFRNRVQALKAQGMVPPDAKVAVSTQSCGIFSNQSNTFVLYVGPYSTPFRGCAARLAGPPDSFIKGANPDSAHSYLSCLCPADPGKIPQIGPNGGDRSWIGELQRVLGNRLSISVGPLGPTEWGVYTPGTQAAVKQFQASTKLPPTGVVDARTWSALRTAQC